MELLCEYKFQGDKFLCDLLEEKLKKENFTLMKKKKTILECYLHEYAVLFRLKHYFDLGQDVIKPLKPKLFV